MKDKKKIEALVSSLKMYNEAYRKGKPLISDNRYDTLIEELRGLDPENQYLKTVEPERLDVKKEVRHPVAMLSTEKAYEKEDLERFVARVAKAALEIGITEVSYRVTAKLDGLAGRDDGEVLATRGNGSVGYDVTSVFGKGVVAEGGRGLGLGEIVSSLSYFEENLADKFEHPRNMVVGIVTADNVNEDAMEALSDGAVRFVPYATLPDWFGTGEELVENLDQVRSKVLDVVDYPVDGMVAEVTDERIREHMGYTNHHYRWQIAIKTRGETGIGVVEQVKWQVGRTGNVTPVMEISPVKISGATIRRVTAHNAGLLKKEGIGVGTKIEIIRSGEVIPKLERVVSDSCEAQLPETCPVCDHEIVWSNDFLKCMNPMCEAKTVQRILHWFKTLGNADWFGIKTVEKLVAGNYRTLEAIYAMTEEDFLNLDFGPVQSRNLAEAIVQSRTKQVEDFRFLAAFGIPNLGRGDGRRLLEEMPLEELLEADEDGIKKIHGFAEITSKSIVSGIKELKETISHMMNMDFNLERTPLARDTEEVESGISGKGIVFTGKMVRGSRGDMQDMARKLGAKVQSSVSGKTDFLVCGEKVGASKIGKAEGLGVQVITEADFFDMIS